MEEIHKTSLLRVFALRQVESAGSSERSTWRFIEGIILFPEARCPYCHEPMRSQRIWQARSGMVLGCWEIKEGKLVKQAVRHPHVLNNGAICMGNQPLGKEMSALFLGLNFISSYFTYEHFSDWLLSEFNHVCGTRDLKPILRTR